MRRKLKFIICFVLVLILCTSNGFANKSEGDLYTFCPYLSILFYNDTMKNFLDLNDTQAALLQVSSDGIQEGNLTYSNIMQDTFFIFGGTTEEFSTASTAYVYCSLKDSSVLKNIPMIIWASIIQYKYYGEIVETGSSFLEWVNEGRRDGDTFTTPFFTARYSEEARDNCSLLLIKLN